MDLIATAAFGLEAIVARELEALGYSATNIQAGRILFEGDAAAVCRANLWLRTAERVLVRVGEFEVLDFGTLFDATYALPWEEWIAADDEFPVSGRSVRSQFSSVPACQKIVKKAIVEKLRAAHHVEELPETGPKRSIEIALLGNRATLTIDTTGPGLHKTGLSNPGRPGAAQGDVGGGHGALELLAARASAGRSLLRQRHDPHRGRPDRP